MFGRDRDEKLSARAVVIDAKESTMLRAGVNTIASNGPSAHTIYRVRVVPENGQPEFEANVSAWGQFAHFGRSLRGCWIQVVYNRDAPDKCELDKDWLHGLDLDTWTLTALSQRDRRYMFGDPDAAPSHGDSVAAAATGRPAGSHAEVAAYWKQYAEQAVAARQAAIANVAPGLATAPPASVEDRLATLDKLHDAGTLTDDEYRAKRQQIIDSI
jgi:hypothetical protein